VDISTRPGEGTTLRIKIPLTLAIIPALIVSDGTGDRYAIPQVNLLELVRLEGRQAQSGVEWIQEAPFYRLRGNLLPLVRLRQVLGLPASGRDAADEVNIVVLKADDRQFGLIVDAINDTEEIVVKPLGKQLQGVSVFAGATIMGDGQVALILDTLAIGQRARVVSEAQERGSLAEAGERRAVGGDAGQQTLLVVSTDDDQRMAIPLEVVARLEEFPHTAIEAAGAHRVVQYRGEILPLVGLSPAAAGAADPAQHAVVVLKHQRGSVGLMVDRILDIVTVAEVEPHPLASSPGSRPAIIQGRVTQIVDVDALLGGRFTGGAAA
jgi:two-component system chemotaxis sensor kinase CheA